VSKANGLISRRRRPTQHLTLLCIMHELINAAQPLFKLFLGCSRCLIIHGQFTVICMKNLHAQPLSPLPTSLFPESSESSESGESIFRSIRSIRRCLIIHGQFVMICVRFTTLQHLSASAQTSTPWRSQHYQS